jgi:hypothetical protein
MPDQDVLDRPASRPGTAATVSRVDDAFAETLGNLMLWLIPVVAFLMALLSIR